jgi:hypothetical protein
VTASASIMPWGRLLIPFAGHKTKNLLIARLFVNRVRFRDFREGLMGNKLITEHLSFHIY